MCDRGGPTDWGTVGGYLRCNLNKPPLACCMCRSARQPLGGLLCSLTYILCLVAVLTTMMVT